LSFIYKVEREICWKVAMQNMLMNVHLAPRITLAECCAGSLGLLFVAQVTEKVMAYMTTWMASPPGAAMLPTVARFLRGFNLTMEECVTADNPDPKVAEKRRQALKKLGERLAKYVAADGESGKMADLRFTNVSRVPFPFSQMAAKALPVSSPYVKEVHGVVAKDELGNDLVDLSGSYGVNVAGHDSYKGFVERGTKRVMDAGVVLGPIHPVVRENVESLRKLSGLDEVSFHMSGTEAVMAATQVLRFNRKRKLIVKFAGAYHGWWDGVLPAPANTDRVAGDVLTLKDLSQVSLAAIRMRSSEIAGVMVSPYQSFHPGAPPPNDLTLLTSDIRVVEESEDKVRERYTNWLKQLRQVCDENDIPLVYDEVYSGFRLGHSGAIGFFGVQPDMVLYGKTLGGGLAVGVVCGKAELMQRTEPGHPMRVCYTLGTFSAAPSVMGTMREFLDWHEKAETPALYTSIAKNLRKSLTDFNKAMEQAGVPVRAAVLQTVFTLVFTQPSMYNWLLQFYLRAEGLCMSWVGTGRLILPVTTTEKELDMIVAKMTSAAKTMAADGWWTAGSKSPAAVKRMIGQKVAWATVADPMVDFYERIMEQKAVDHHASHSNLINQFMHLVSSAIFLVCYWVIVASRFGHYRMAMFWGLGSLILRQSGHYIFEPPCAEREALSLGFDTAKKVKICIAFALVPFTLLLQPALAKMGVSLEMGLADVWMMLTLVVVFGRVVFLQRKFCLRIAMHWFIKFITDPITDIPAYIRSGYQIFDPTLVRDALATSFPAYYPNHKFSAKSVEHGWGAEPEVFKKLNKSD